MDRQPLLVTPRQQQAIAAMLRQWEGADPRAILKRPDGFTVNLPPAPPPAPNAGSGSARKYAKLVDNRTAGGLYRAFFWTFGSKNTLPAILVEEGDVGAIGTQEISVFNMFEMGENTHLLMGDSPPLVVFEVHPTGITDVDGFEVWATWAVRLSPTCTVSG